MQVRVAVLLACVCTAASLPAAGAPRGRVVAPWGDAAQGVDVTGTWAFDVQTDAGGGTPTITFKQDGEKLTGRYDGQLGTAELTGTVKGTTIHFTFTVDVQGQQAPVTYDGTVEKDTMKGTMNIAGMVNGTFTAARKK